MHTRAVVSDTYRNADLTKLTSFCCTERKKLFAFCISFCFAFCISLCFTSCTALCLPFSLHYVLLIPTLHVSMFCMEDLRQTVKYQPWKPVPALTNMWPCLLLWNSPLFCLLKETKELAAERRGATSQESLCPVTPDKATTKSATHRRIVTNKQTNIVWFYLLLSFTGF